MSNVTLSQKLPYANVINGVLLALAVFVKTGTALYDLANMTYCT